MTTPAHRRSRRRLLNAFAGWAAALALPEASGHVEGAAAKAGVAPKSRLFTERRMPAFRVQDPAGKPITENDFLGHWTYVFLGYTSCPDACPTTLAALTQAFERLGDDAQRVRALFLSVDPRRDRPEMLAAYLANFSPRIRAGSGSSGHMAATARAFGMRFEIVGDPASATYTIDHPVAMLLFDPDGRFVTLVPPGASSAELAADLRNRIQPRKKP